MAHYKKTNDFPRDSSQRRILFELSNDSQAAFTNEAAIEVPLTRIKAATTLAVRISCIQKSLLCEKAHCKLRLLRPMIRR